MVSFLYHRFVKVMISVMGMVTIMRTVMVMGREFDRTEVRVESLDV